MRAACAASGYTSLDTAKDENHSDMIRLFEAASWLQKVVFISEVTENLRIMGRLCLCAA